MSAPNTQGNELLNNAHTKTVADPQTGEVYDLHEETRNDTIMAYFSIAYLLLFLLLIFWFLFDIWYSAASLLEQTGYVELEKLRAASTIRLIAYAVIGGALGGIVNGIRSFIVWHCDRHAVGSRFALKYVADPWLGATLALFAFALVQSGVAVLGGQISPGSVGLTQVMAMFGVGVLTGYGSRNVFTWLDEQVNNLFKTTQSPQIESLPTGDSQDGGSTMSDSHASNP